MTTLPWWWWAVIGCPWISPAEHRDNLAKQDGDADADTDADTDSPHTGHSITGCVEDADEDNDVYEDAVALTVPAALDATSCAGDVDWWKVELTAVAGLDVLTAELDCSGDVVLRIWHDGRLGVTTERACGKTTRLGLGAGTYAVQIAPRDGGDLGEYQLSLDTEGCGLDGDGDGQPSVACPGAGDCDDADGTVYRFAADDPDTPVDEDCDGANDRKPRTTCNANLNGAVPGLPELACGDPDIDPVWHHFTFDADSVNVDAFLTPVGANADLIGWYSDDLGVYGLDQGETELDAEDDCDPASYGQCPAMCLEPGVGTGHLWVAQRGCSGPAAYELRLAPPTIRSQEFDVGPPPPLR